ncbi:MAG: Zn-dependent hydrolase, partial [Burkholderiaceae bacterium]
MDLNTTPSSSTTALRTDGARLWQSLMDLARIGGTPKGGVCRIALTDLDRQGRDLFTQWAREDVADRVHADAAARLARRAGADDSLPPVGWVSMWL